MKRTPNSSMIELIPTKNEPRIDSRLMATLLERKHASVYSLLNKHRSDFEEVGILRFQIGEINGRGQPEKYALLNEDQAYLLLAYSRNTSRIRALKVKLIHSFGECRRAAISRETQYLPAYHAMSETIHVLANGSPKERFIHMNVNRLVNKVVGIEAGQRQKLGVSEQTLVIVAQTVITNAMQGSKNAHEGYERARVAVNRLSGALQHKQLEGQP